MNRKKRVVPARTAKQDSWAQSARFRALGSENMRRFNRLQWLAPKCGAMARSTGEPCRQPAMPNGKCRYHGGLTPSGDAWHKPRWPAATASDWNERLNRKLRDLDRAKRKREKRIAAMTPEERVRYDKWVRAHKPGSAAKRAVARTEIEGAIWLAELRQRPDKAQSPNPERDQLRADIAAVEAEIARLKAELEAAEEQPTPDLGVFS